MTVLRLEGTSVAFRGRAAVEDVTLTVGEGEAVALVGLNGAGKTTLMRLALGMVRPDRGTVGVLGHPISEVPAASWARVGSLIEVPLAYPELTVRENLSITALLRRAHSACVTRALEEWQLEHVANRRFRHLSLGTRQRVGLATALLHHPDLVLLDEPTNALDPASVILLRNHLTRRRAEGAAILVSSHHLDEVARTATRVSLMNRGRLIGELDTGDADLERAFFTRIHDDDRRTGHTMVTL